MISAVIFALVIGFNLNGIDSNASEDKRPAEIILKTAKIPTNFNHEKHQENFECEVCHHSKNSDGTMGPYVEGEQQTCVSCHNMKDMAETVIRGTEKLNSFKGAAHASCVGCHYARLKAGKEAGPTKKGNGKCVGCHPSKKQYCPVRKWL